MSGNPGAPECHVSLTEGKSRNLLLTIASRSSSRSISQKAEGKHLNPAPDQLD
jgi:hypothetical protein